MTHGAIVLLYLGFIGLALFGAWSVHMLRVRRFRRARGRRCVSAQPSLGVSSLNWPGCVSSVSGPFSEGIR